MLLPNRPTPRLVRIAEEGAHLVDERFVLMTDVPSCRSHIQV